ncbi:MAG: hypothetical protein V3U11_13795, partial [Planctomycetota bacterium]
ENVSPRPQARKPRRFDGARWRLNRSTARHRIRHARSDVFFGSAASENAEQHNIPALVDLVAHLRRRGIAVVLVAFPCHAAYEAERPPTWDAIVDRAVSEVRSGSGFSDVPFWDYRNDAQFHDLDFHHVDHLSARGAERFSGILALRIQKLSLPAPRTPQPGTPR